MGLDLLATFSVIKKESVADSASMIQPMMVPDEIIELVYASVRDKVWFTNKRLIALDVQGLTGKKKEYRSFPYSKISSLSVETSGTFDFDGDFKIWVSGVGVFEIKFSKRLNIAEVGNYMSLKLLSPEV